MNITLSQLIIALVIQLILFLLVNYLKPYLNKRGESLATRKDIDEITEKVEGVKNQFFEHQKRFSLYEEKRFETIEEVLNRLLVLFDSFDALIFYSNRKGIDENKRLKDETIEKFNELTYYYRVRKIYLDDEISSRIEKISKTSLKIIHGYEPRYILQHSKGEEELKQIGVLITEVIPNLREDLFDTVKELLSTPISKTSEI